MSFYETPHQQPLKRTKDFFTFITSEFYSEDPPSKELGTDRNMNTGIRYKDIFEMRAVKNKFLFSIIPSLTPNSYFMRYEDLKTNSQKIFAEISSKFNLVSKFPEFIIEPKRVLPPQIGIEFPLSDDPPHENYVVEDAEAKDVIKSRLDFDVEELVGYDRESILRRLE